MMIFVTWVTFNSYFQVISCLKLQEDDMSRTSLSHSLVVKLPTTRIDKSGRWEYIVSQLFDQIEACEKWDILIWLWLFLFLPFFFGCCLFYEMRCGLCGWSWLVSTMAPICNYVCSIHCQLGCTTSIFFTMKPSPIAIRFTLIRPLNNNHSHHSFMKYINKYIYLFSSEFQIYVSLYRPATTNIFAERGKKFKTNNTDAADLIW